MPQISIPGSDVKGAPVGLSLLAGNIEDAFLLGVLGVLGTEMLGS